MTESLLNEKWNDRDREQFSKVANTLIDFTFISAREWDSSRNRSVRCELYFSARQFFPVLKEYFSLLGWEVIFDDTYESIMLRRPNSFSDRIKKYTTLFIYACRLLYEEELQKGASSLLVDCTEARVLEKLQILQALDSRKPTWIERNEALKYMETHNLIQKKHSGAWNSKESNEFVIHPTLAMMLDSVTIRETEKRIDTIISRQKAESNEENNDEHE